MKIFGGLAAIVLTLAIPVSSWSQSGTSGGANGGGQDWNQGSAPGNGQGQKWAQQGEEYRFEQHKAEVLKHLNERLAEMHQRKSCIEAANDHQALMACNPMGGDHNHGANDAGPGGSDGKGLTDQGGSQNGASPNGPSSDGAAPGMPPEKIQGGPPVGSSGGQ